MKRDREYYRKIGQKGGLATVAKHGRAHMAEIGAKGFQVTTCRYFLGDDVAHKRFLALMGGHVYWRDSGVDMKYDRDGNPVWPEEMPVHPAHNAAPGQRSLFESVHMSNWDDLPW